MDIINLIERFIQSYNRNYTNYCNLDREPRYALKRFFYSTYQLLSIIGPNWYVYLEQFQELFLINPNNDWYGHRNPCDTNLRNARENALEWLTIVEIIVNVGFPYNESAVRELLRYLRTNIDAAMSQPNYGYNDIMLSAIVENMADRFPHLREWYINWIRPQVESNTNLNIHQLVAYFNAIRNEPSLDDLRTQIVGRILAWMQNPEGTTENQVLIWARICIRMQDVPDIRDFPALGDNFFNNLSNIHQANYHNYPILLQAVYLLSDDNQKITIADSIDRYIMPTHLSQLRQIFPFLSDEVIENSELQRGIFTVQEKCIPHVSQGMCNLCRDTPQGICWGRILSTFFQTNVWVHNVMEVGDLAIFRPQQGIYFVIKATPIPQLRGNGDTLIRQCINLFQTDHALIFYFKPL